MGNTVTTGAGRLSWPRLAKLEVRPNATRATVSTALLIPKTDQQTITALSELVRSTIAAKWGAEPPKNLRIPLKDGDASEYVEQHGHILLNASSGRMVPVVGPDLAPLDPGDVNLVYGGANARIVVGAFAYDASGNRGVSLSLEAVMILGGGEPFAPVLDLSKAFGVAAPTGFAAAGVTSPAPQPALGPEPSFGVPTSAPAAPAAPTPSADPLAGIL